MQYGNSAKSRLVIGVSAIAIAALPASALAQDAAATVGQPGDSETPATSAQEAAPAEIVVTGIRASLRRAVDIKRDSVGVVDAISAEDIGKFPDTNLAESLQRITGVSIDRQNGEGSTVTVRGFGPEFNLVTLNGRQMPTSTLGDGGSAPSSRSFDFANLAAEGVAGVEVYKTGRAAIPSGGIGSSINIRTPRPLDRVGFRGSVAVKGVWDSSRIEDLTPTPEVSGIISNTFGDDRFGILLSGSFQKRRASQNSANVGYRDGYLGSENNWGSLPQPGEPGSQNIINRPDPTDVYQVPQNASYNLVDINRKRINGQLVLQARPIDTLTATADYTFSRNAVQVRDSNVGIWFNHVDRSSEWTDGPVAGPVFLTERFDVPNCQAPARPICADPNDPTKGINIGKDLSYGGSLTKNMSTNKSVGGNLTWTGLAGLNLQLDAHRSTAESKPDSPYGSSVAVGTAVFGVASQTIDFTRDFPVLSYTMYPRTVPINRDLAPTPINALDASQIVPTGNAFRNAYFKNKINQVQLKGRYDFDTSFLDSVDFGVSHIDSKVRSAFGVFQNDTWGGVGPASDIPDDIFTQVSIPNEFEGVSGSKDPNVIQTFYTFDFERLVDELGTRYGVCQGGTNCLAPYTTDRRLREKTISPFVQLNNTFDLFTRPAHLVAGVRYEKTKVTSSALVPVPTRTAWVADNEFSVLPTTEQGFTTFKGDYKNWLPAIDFDMAPIENTRLRASYSHTITRPDYASLQGGRTIDQLFRVGGGFGNQGNPGLLPFKSKNIDLSAEWYYGRESYVSIGHFRKKVKNFISSDRIDATAFDLRTPVGGPRYNAAIAALGPNAGTGAIRNYIATNFPNTTEVRNGQLFVFATADDPLLNFQINTPVNSDDIAKLNGWEVALQHSFWDTGFGVILNYTKVNGDVRYDPRQPSSVTQFTLPGLSDSANAVAFYDKNGVQARIAYNWRDKFLAAGGANPLFVEKYGQVDASASWEFLPGWTGFVEAINLLGADRRGHARSKNNVVFVQPGYARYSGGIRYAF